MKRSILSMASVASFGLAFGPRSLAAQQAEPASIPTVLAQVLAFPFSRMLGDHPHYVVGRTPPGWPQAFHAPASARLIGGVKFGPMLATVYRVPRRVDAIQVFQRLFADAGYTRRVSHMGPRGGFTSAESPETAAWCSPNGTANVMVFDSTAASRSVVVSVASSPMSSPACSPSATHEDRMKPPLEIPTLTAPVGVWATAEGTGWSGNNMRTSVSVDTTLTADSLLSHYAGQLTAAGWQAGKRLSDGRNALQPLSVHDSNGKLWVGALTLITAADRRSVMLNMIPGSHEQ